MKRNKTLLVIGWLLLIVAVVDAVDVIIGFIKNSYVVPANPDQLVQTVQTVVIIVGISFSIISILVNAFLGIRGITESSNPSGGKAHIVIAKILAVLCVIVCVLSAIALFSSKDLLADIVALAIYIVDASLMFIYVREAKAVRGN